MRGDYEELLCPICKKGKVTLIHIPPVISIRTSRTASLPGNKTFRKSLDIWIVKSSCSECKASAAAIEDRLKKEGLI